MGLLSWFIEWRAEIGQAWVCLQISSFNQDKASPMWLAHSIRLVWATRTCVISILIQINYLTQCFNAFENIPSQKT